MIKSVDIDFHPQQRPSFVGALVLIGAAILSAVLLNQWLDNRRALQSLQEDIDSIEREHRRIFASNARAVSRQPNEAVVEQWLAVHRSLHLPWFSLLSQLEHSLSEEVSVLQFKSNLADRQVQLLIEARDVPTALDWLERLGRTRVLREPRLIAQRLQLDEAGHPVQIQVSVEMP